MTTCLVAPRLRAAALCLALLTLAACDSGDSVDPPIGITGRWVGHLDNVDEPLQPFPVTVTLNDSGFNVTGTGSVRFPGDSLLSFVIVDGLFADPKVSLPALYPVPPPGSLSGRLTVGRDSIIGTLTGPGQVNARVALGLQR